MPDTIETTLGDVTREEIVEYMTTYAGGCRGLPLEFVDHQSDRFLRRFAELAGETFGEWLAEGELTLA